MDCKKYEGKFAKIIIERKDAYFGTVKTVEENLVVFKCTSGEILTLKPESIINITANGGD